MLVPTMVVSITVFLVSSRLPKLYKSETLVLVDPQKVPTDYVRPTISGDVSDRLQTISQEILSRTRLQKIIDQFGLYKDQKNLVQEDIVEMMRKDITLEIVVDPRARPGTGVGGFKISYAGATPTLAQQVTRQIASLFIEENLKVREQQATDHWRGCRDRSWGVRPVGEPEPAGIRQGVPAMSGMWNYFPMQFSDHSIFFINNELADGARVLEQADRVWPDGRIEQLGRVEWHHDMQKGTRLMTHSVLTFPDAPGGKIEIECTSLLPHFLAVGSGYGLDDDWRHGMYQGPDLVLHGRDYKVDEIAMRGQFAVVDHVARFEYDGNVGYGLYEQAFMGAFPRVGAHLDSHPAAFKGEVGSDECKLMEPPILTALAAVLAFIPLTHSVFWGSMAYALIGGTAVGTVLILLFLPALYTAWFRIKSPPVDAREDNAAPFGTPFSFARSEAQRPRTNS